MAVTETQDPDVLAQVLDALRLRSRLFCRSELTASWTIAFRAGRFAHFHLVERGTAWIHMDGQAPVRLAPGDAALVPHGTGHSLSDGQGAPTIALDTLVAQMPPGSGHIVRHGGGGDETQLICGAFQFEPPESLPLLSLLPELIHMSGEDEGPGPLDLAKRLATEARAGRPGTNAVVTRLMDVLFVDGVRTALRRTPEAIGGWLGALRDPQIGAALRAMHGFPERTWTVSALAAEAALSRSPFAERFGQLVGEPPMTYLTRWRMQLAARLLRDPHARIEDVAERVGYSSATALSRAFKHWFQVSPRTFARGRPAIEDEI
jgi:AraC-like DNA-binding protein